MKKRLRDVLYLKIRGWGKLGNGLWVQNFDPNVPRSDPYRKIYCSGMFTYKDALKKAREDDPKNKPTKGWEPNTNPYRNKKKETSNENKES